MAPLLAYLSYRDAPAAIDWLEAIGFRVVTRQPGDDGAVLHTELSCGDAVVMLATADGSPEWLLDRAGTPLGYRRAPGQHGVQVHGGRFAEDGVTGDNTVVLAADFYRAGDGNDESFNANMIVSETDIDRDVQGDQNVWIQGVGCASATVHISP
jgi:hypothetical protein